MDWKTLAKTLAAGVSSSAATAVLQYATDSGAHITPKGLGIATLIGAALYLKQSPLLEKQIAGGTPAAVDHNTPQQNPPAN